MPGRGKVRRRSLIVFILVLAGAGGFSLWQAHHTPELNCQQARWQARGAWEDAASRLGSLADRLNQDDIKLMESGALDLAQAGRWRMWRTAQAQASQAIADSYEDPIAARTAAVDASVACRVARETSPKVHRGGNVGRAYLPGSRALRACYKAAEVSEQVWEACAFLIGEVNFGGGDDLDLDFFKGCSN